MPTQMDHVEIRCDGGAIGASWQTLVTWTSNADGYVLCVTNDLANCQLQGSRKFLSLEALVEDCLSHPELRVYGDFFDQVQVVGLSSSMADILKLAFVEDEDNPISKTYIDRLLVQPDAVVEMIIRESGSLWSRDTQDLVKRLTDWCERLGLPFDLAAAGTSVAWERSQGIGTLEFRLDEVWKKDGFRRCADVFTSGEPIGTFMELNPRPTPNSVQEWVMLLEIALDTGTFEKPGELGLLFLNWLIEKLPVKDISENHSTTLRKLSDSAISYVKGTIDRDAPAPGGYAMGKGILIKQFRDRIYDSLVSRNWLG